MLRWLRSRRKPKVQAIPWGSPADLASEEYLRELAWIDNPPYILPDKYIGPGDWSQARLLSTEHMVGEHPASNFRRCDLCMFSVNSEDDNILDWAIRDHMRRVHPTKGGLPNG